MRHLNVILLFLVSCTLYPKYVREVEFAMPSDWRIEFCEMNELGNVNWWRNLGDPVLDGYIQEALGANQDLQVAIATVDAFAAQLGVVRSQLFPQISGSGSAGRAKVSQTTEQLLPGEPAINNAYDLVLNASFQLDIWGQIRSAVDAAKAQLYASIETRRTVVLTLISSVASTYVLMRQFDEQLRIAKETKAARDESYRLAVIRFELGLTSMLPVDQAKSEVEDAQTTIDQIAIQVALTEDLLCFLMGKAPMTPERGKLLGEIYMPPCVPAYLPSELLNQRPDILAAEQQLIAANAQIGVARAAFFPNFSLTGQYGAEGTTWHNLFTKPSSIWEYGINLLQEIFTGGELTNQLRFTEAQQREALHQYQSTILNAFKEVNDSLISHRISLDLERDQKIKVDTLKDYLRLSWLRYQNGLVDYLTFLDAERQFFRAELAYTEAQAQSFTTLIDLYKALGGGWVVAADCSLELPE
ncbi:MAG: efflux transporter outer membrane subunit [Verrucomicrobia bacterium]|nr:efflux transporter outer membrane subunit [Verrucomicrobiota bacterium]MBU6445970.1 efflux transporter outer membrane subunit [Verrucomicrobiota bacterium]MDE3047655.1 efflux transporter outer membrane subunit [Verrucomicrobiota bacterium]